VSFQHHILEALLALRLQPNTGQAEIAQRMIDQLPLHGSQGGAFLLGNRFVGAIQWLTLSEVGLIRG